MNVVLSALFDNKNKYHGEHENRRKWTLEQNTAQQTQEKFVKKQFKNLYIKVNNKIANKIDH